MESQTFELLEPPSDGITSLSFSPCSNDLLVSSWDSTVRLYDVHQNKVKSRFSVGSACLSSAFHHDGTRAFSGGLDNSIKLLDFETGTSTPIGSHDLAVSTLSYNSTHSKLFSGSWDSTLKSWDSRTPSFESATYSTPGKIYSISTTGNKLIVATVHRNILIYDLRKLSPSNPEPESTRESPLRHQTRVVKCSPDEGCFAVGSVEGRLAVEFVDPEEQLTRKYAFKCHRQAEYAYAVNDISYHPLFGTFATGGGDGMVNIWDGSNKRRLSQIGPYPTSISALSFNEDGSLLAIASSFTFETGEKSSSSPSPSDQIFIHSLSENQVRPRFKE